MNLIIATRLQLAPEASTLVAGNSRKDMVSVLLNGQTVADTLANGKKTILTDTEFFTTQTVTNMRVSGLIIKRMASEYSHTRTVPGILEAFLMTRSITLGMSRG